MLFRHPSEPPRRCESIYVAESFVSSDPLDAGKAERKSACVAVAFLDRIEGDLDDNLRLDFDSVSLA